MKSMACTKRTNHKPSSGGKKVCFPGKPIPKDCQGPQSVPVLVAASEASPPEVGPTPQQMVSSAPMPSISDTLETVLLQR